jgi:hypothetical protein
LSSGIASLERERHGVVLGELEAQLVDAAVRLAGALDQVQAARIAPVISRLFCRIRSSSVSMSRSAESCDADLLSTLSSVPLPLVGLAQLAHGAAQFIVSKVRSSVSFSAPGETGARVRRAGTEALHSIARSRGVGHSQPGRASSRRCQPRGDRGALGASSRSPARHRAPAVGASERRLSESSRKRRIDRRLRAPLPPATTSDRPK